MALSQIPLDTYGSADFVSEIHTTKRVEWGGFEALLCRDGFEGKEPILILAKMWTGAQPRLVLDGGHAGYKDWRKLLDAAPECNMLSRFVGSAQASSDVFSQWRTHGPSDLL